MLDGIEQRLARNRVARRARSGSISVARRIRYGRCVGVESRRRDLRVPAATCRSTAPIPLPRACSNSSRRTARAAISPSTCTCRACSKRSAASRNSSCTATATSSHSSAKPRAPRVASVLEPRKLRWKQIAMELQLAGVNALPIVGLLAFLLGVVIAYQGGTVLRDYGANIFIVDIVALVDGARTRAVDHRNHRCRTHRFRLHRADRHDGGHGRRSTRCAASASRRRNCWCCRR